MKCPGSSFPWEDLLDRRLSDDRTKELMAHLQVCAGCRAGFQEAAALRNTLSRLPKRMTPRRDLWQDIEKRIHSGVRDARAPGYSRLLRFGARAPGRSRVYRFAPLAAAALLLAGILVASLVQVLSPPSPRGFVTQLVSLGGGSPSIVRRFSEIERRYQRVKTGFLETMESSGDAVDPRFASMVATQLEIIDQAVNELERALEAQPENRMLWLLMAQANESRMEILQTAQTYLY
jgi:anti-sigma factor RsiW